MAVLCLTFWGTTKVLSIVAAPLHILTSDTQGFQFLLTVFFDNSYPNKCQVVSHCGFHLYSKEGVLLPMALKHFVSEGVPMALVHLHSPKMCLIFWLSIMVLKSLPLIHCTSHFKSCPLWLPLYSAFSAFLAHPFTYVSQKCWSIYNHTLPVSSTHSFNFWKNLLLPALLAL